MEDHSKGFLCKISFRLKNVFNYHKCKISKISLNKGDSKKVQKTVVNL